MIQHGFHFGLHRLDLRGKFGVRLGDLVEILVALRDILLGGDERLLGFDFLALGKLKRLGGGFDQQSLGFRGLAGFGELGTDSGEGLLKRWEFVFSFL